MKINISTMTNNDYMVVKHLIPMIVKSYNAGRCSFKAMTEIRESLKRRNIDENFSMEVRRIDKDYSVIAFTFKETRSIDDPVHSVIVVNRTLKVAHYYVLRHSVYYQVVEDSSTFDFAVKGCTYSIFEVELNNEYGSNDGLETADLEIFIENALSIAKVDDSCFGKREKDELAAIHEEGMATLQEQFAWGRFVELLNKLDELYE